MLALSLSDTNTAGKLLQVVFLRMQVTVLQSVKDVGDAPCDAARALRLQEDVLGLLSVRNIPRSFFILFFFFLNRSVVNFQCCVNFRGTAE